MSEPLLDADTLADLREIEVSGLLNTSVGGSSWTVTTQTSTGGVTGPNAGANTTITGYVEQRIGAGGGLTGGSTAGAQVPDSNWFLVVTSGTVAVGAKIQSTAAPQWKFVIKAPRVDPLYPTYLLEQQR
jgi:hypothetical protein